MKSLSDMEIKEKIIEIVKDILPESKIILFGSRAKGKNRENSDYDIAVIYKEKIPSKIYFNIQEKLDNLYTLKTIDLSDFSNLDEDFQDIVIKEGILLYNGTMEDTAEKI